MPNWDPSLGPKPDKWDELSTSDKERWLADARAAKKGNQSKGKSAGDKAQEKIREMISGPADFYKKLLETAEGPMEKHYKTLLSIQEANREMLKTGGDFYSKLGTGGEYNTAIQEVARASADFFGSSEKGINTFRKFSQGMESFIGTSQNFQKTMGESLMMMEEMGFNTTQMAQALNEQAMAFGQTENQLKSFAASMTTLSRQLYLDPQTMMKDYMYVQKNFAHSADQTLDIFQKLQKQSKVTGVEFGTLADKFGGSMDTFSGVTQIAGRLNAVMGKSVFNPIELLNMDEAERAKTIRARVQANTQDINQMSKYEMKAIADGLNMNIGDARKFLTQEGEGGVRGNFRKQIETREKQIATGDDLTKTTEMLKATIENTRFPLEQFSIAVSKYGHQILDAANATATQAYTGLRPDEDQARNNTFGQEMANQGIITGTRSSDEYNRDGKFVTGRDFADRRIAAGERSDVGARGKEMPMTASTYAVAKASEGLGPIKRTALIYAKTPPVPGETNRDVDVETIEEKRGEQASGGIEKQKKPKKDKDMAEITRESIITNKKVARAIAKLEATLAAGIPINIPH